MRFDCSSAVSRRTVTVVAVAALAWLAVASTQAGPEPAAGKFLVASRDLSDPNFRETVVLLLDYGPGGAMGLVINRPTKATVPDVLPELDEVRHVEELVYRGGPVSPDSVMMLLRSPVALEQSKVVFGDIHMSQSAELLRRYAGADTDEPGYRLYVGYAGWGPGQLDGEVERGDWHIVAADSELVLTEKPSTTWSRLVPAPRSLQASGPTERRSLR